MICPLVSVIVPVFNTEKYINACVESIICQTYENIELILVDDGSTDSSPAICDEWALKDKRIKVIHQQNRGAAAARNAGMKAASGKYIGFVDSDDYINRRMYEVLVEGLMQSPARISCCYFTRDYNDMLDGASCSRGAREYNVVDALNAFFAGKEISSSACDKLFERGLFDNIVFPEGETNEEFPILIPLLVRAGGVFHCAKTFYFYRATQQSVTHLLWKNNTYVVLKHLNEMKRQLEEFGLKEQCGNFGSFCGKAAYSIALAIDKNYHSASEEAKRDQKKYLSVMRSRMINCLLSDNFEVKDKVLYIMVAFRILRPIYRMLGKL